MVRAMIAGFLQTENGKTLLTEGGDPILIQPGRRVLYFDFLTTEDGIPLALEDGTEILLESEESAYVFPLLDLDAPEGPLLPGGLGYDELDEVELNGCGPGLTAIAPALDLAAFARPLALTEPGNTTRVIRIRGQSRRGRPQ